MPEANSFNVDFLLRSISATVLFVNIFTVIVLLKMKLLGSLKRRRESLLNQDGRYTRRVSKMVKMVEHPVKEWTSVANESGDDTADIGKAPLRKIFPSVMGIGLFIFVLFLVVTINIRFLMINLEIHRNETEPVMWNMVSFCIFFVIVNCIFIRALKVFFNYLKSPHLALPHNLEREQVTSFALT